MASGKFVLRLPIDLHSSFQKEAKERDVSLNSLVLEKVGASASNVEIQVAVNVFKEALLGIVQFGSTVRGEGRATSDIDWLLILGENVPIERSLYRIWDQRVAPKLNKPYSPQFVHVPRDWNAISSLWLEVGLEGEVQFDPRNRIRPVMARIKSLIAEGKFRRHLSHGHPYWVKKT